MPIVIAGDALSGFTFYGPFETPSAAIAWATDNCCETWVIGALSAPKEN